ncbi:MAG: SRPBCC family protein [Alphaproteobacteria bacterium]|nr:SRPBCC family protein [Alphaproteobacteria bacterium]
MRHLFAALFVLTNPLAVQAADAVKETSYVANGSRVLRHEVVVAASAADAWSAFTTVDGWRSWAAPYVTLSTTQLAVDAELESSYDLNAKPNDERNIRQRVLAYIPERMFAFRTVQSPKDFPFPEEVRQVFSVVEFESLGAKRTRVSLSMIGYGSGARFDGLYGFFSKGNPWSLAKLVERFETGPVDWKKALAKPAH